MLIAEFERAMAEKPSLGDDTTLPEQASAPGHWPGPQPMDDQRDDVDMSADTAVTLMKEAVASSIKHNDIQHDAVGPHSLIRLSPPKDTDMQH